MLNPFININSNLFESLFLNFKNIKSISGELLLPLSNPKFFNVLMLLDPEKRRSVDYIPKLCSFDPDSGNYNNIKKGTYIERGELSKVSFSSTNWTRNK